MSKSPSAANKALDTITATGPGLPVVATPSARLMMLGSVASASARTVHLVIGWNNTCWSIYVLPGRHMPATLASAVRATMAFEALNASYMPWARCQAYPWLAADFTICRGHQRGAFLIPHGDHAYP